MKIKKLTIRAILLCVVVLVGIVGVFATSARTQKQADDEDISEALRQKAESNVSLMEKIEYEKENLAEAEQTVKNVDISVETEQKRYNEAGMIMQGIDAPDVVLSAAWEWTKAHYNLALEGEYDNDYSNWRIEALEHIYTYEDLEGMTLLVYRLNYRFFTEHPENLTLAGGASVDEDGWTVPDYPNSHYLVFEQKGDVLSYITPLFENDCFPGDEQFTSDLRRRIMEGEDIAEVNLIKSTMFAFCTAYFEADTDTMKQYMAAGYIGEVEGYEVLKPDEEITFWGIAGLDKVKKANEGDTQILSYQFRAPGEDSFTYLTVELVKETEGWKITSYGLEK